MKLTLLIIFLFAILFINRILRPTKTTIPQTSVHTSTNTITPSTIISPTTPAVTHPSIRRNFNNDGNRERERGDDD